MKRLLGLLLLAALPAHAATVGAPAPDFTLENVASGTVRLSQYLGKTVVLEWVNPECPYVRKHYGSANMQRLQKDATARGVVWLAINSTRAGHAEYKAPAEMAGWMKQMNGAATATLLDPKGVLAYAGGIDDKRSTDPEDVKTAKNYVRAALDELLAGKAVSQASTQPYGCSVKY